MTMQDAASDCVSAHDLAWAELLGKAERGEIAPTCETCPLWSSVPVCRHSTLQGYQGEGWCPGHEWYCEHHPLYPAWAAGECLRRVNAGMGGKS